MMPKATKIAYVILLLLTTGLTYVRAEEALPTVKKVKDATEFSQYQETYYRACSYEAIYMFEYVDRKKGVQLAHAIYHHAKENNSNVGMYFATFALGTIREQSGNMGLAEKSFLQALKLKEKYQRKCGSLLLGTVRDSPPQEGLRRGKGIRLQSPRRAWHHPHEPDYGLEL